MRYAGKFLILLTWSRWNNWTEARSNRGAPRTHTNLDQPHQIHRAPGASGPDYPAVWGEHDKLITLKHSSCHMFFEISSGDRGMNPSADRTSTLASTFADRAARRPLIPRRVSRVRHRSLFADSINRDRRLLISLPKT